LVESPKNPVSKFFSRILAGLAGRGLAVDRLHYFRGIRSHLESNGFTVRHTSVSFAKSLEARAADLKLQIDGVLTSTGAKKVHVIAHSMGGLDTRFMIAKLEGMRDRVASLTTIGTPHLGTSFADHKLEEKGGNKLIDLMEKVIDLRGFRDLSRAACRSFNESVRNAEAAAKNVFYQTYASAEPRPQVFTLLQPSWDVINDAEGDNDGLVSLTSQAWQAQIVGDDGSVNTVTQKQFPVPADHLNEAGWWDLNEVHGTGPLHRLDSKDKYEDAIKQVYLDIAKDLKARFPV
jgi:triacylglycerol lipase